MKGNNPPFFYSEKQNKNFNEGLNMRVQSKWYRYCINSQVPRVISNDNSTH